MKVEFFVEFVQSSCESFLFCSFLCVFVCRVLEFVCVVLFDFQVKYLP